MTHTKLDVTTADGTMDAYVHAPAGFGPFHTVIVYPDAFGVRASMHDVGERLAKEGYLAVVVNTLYRSGDFAPFNPKTAFNDAPERDRLMGYMSKADGASVMKDTQSLLDALKKEPRAKTDRVAFMGYCMGGRLAFIAATTFGDRAALAAAFHPGRVVTDQADSPHSSASKVKGRVYLGVADKDPSFTAEAQATMKKALDDAKVQYELEVYTDKLHGYAVTDSAVYDQAANERHWKKLLELLTETFHA
jgi:carboxymethylenebutenolidase